MTNAERLIQALQKLTEGQAGQWRTIASMGRIATAGAIDTAMRAGWIDIEGGHSIRLTDLGWQRASTASK